MNKQENSIKKLILFTSSLLAKYKGSDSEWVYFGMIKSDVLDNFELREVPHPLTDEEFLDKMDGV